MSKIILKNASDDLQLVKSGETVNLYDDLKRVAFNGHDFVEIGGLYWATMNVGANSVTDYGKYFQWGDTQGYTASQVGSGSGKKYFDWSTYKYSNSDGSVMTKYNNIDGKTELDKNDDGAQANWGGLWRIPTSAECQTLINATNGSWTTNYQGSGIGGMILTDKTDSSKTLFFPAAGYTLSDHVAQLAHTVYSWTTTINNSNLTQAWFLGGRYDVSYGDDLYGYQWYDSRWPGMTIRPVVG